MLLQFFRVGFEKTKDITFNGYPQFVLMKKHLELRIETNGFESVRPVANIPNNVTSGFKSVGCYAVQYTLQRLGYIADNHIVFLRTNKGAEINFENEINRFYPLILSLKPISVRPFSCFST